MEESKFDKSGIERHEVASEFLTLISFQLICDAETGGKTKLGSISYQWPQHYLNIEGEHGSL